MARLIIEINLDGGAFCHPATGDPDAHWAGQESAALLARFSEKMLDYGMLHAADVGCYDANGAKSLTARLEP